MIKSILSILLMQVFFSILFYPVLIRELLYEIPLSKKIKSF